MRIYLKTSFHIFLYLFTYFISAASFAEAKDFWLSFKVAPTIQDLKLKPAETKEISFEVENLTKENLSLTISFSEFTSFDEEGNVHLLHKETGVQKWLKIEDLNLPQDLSLNSQEKRRVKIRVTVPKEAKEGAYYPAILFSTEKKDQAKSQGFKINQKAQIASLLFLSVEKNKLPTKIAIKEFSAPWFIIKEPFSFRLKVENLSRTFAKIQGDIEIKNVLGIKSNILSLPWQYILNDSSKSFHQPLVWEKKLGFGIYRASLSLYEKDKKEALAGKKIHFLVLPKEAILITLVLLTGLLLPRLRSGSQ